ncbi:MAG: hypothetical protein O2968_18255 [Acidobacteria bacterium]|nr:hypothetical protein [Acidobacteriota bacterium]
MFLETGGVAISEPVTMLTDYMLLLQAWLYGRALRRQGGEDAPETLNKWIAGFYAVAVGAFAGGTLHGFQLMMSRSALIFLLLATVVALTAGAFSLLEAGLESARQPGPSNPLPWMLVARWLWTMAAAAAIAGLIALACPPLHEHFSQNDLAHIVLMLALYSGYRAASLRHGLGG